MQSMHPDLPRVSGKNAHIYPTECPDLCYTHQREIEPVLQVVVACPVIHFVERGEPA